jgi:hypothetical protein
MALTSLQAGAQLVSQSPMNTDGKAAMNDNGAGSKRFCSMLNIRKNKQIPAVQNVEILPGADGRR